jgi:hypothetical protein
MSRHGIQQIANEVWTVQDIQPMPLVKILTTMTVIRLPNGQLFLHSPVKLDPPLKTWLEGLGSVRYVISPNPLHHLYIAPYRDAFKEAKLFALPQLQEKRKDLRIDRFLNDQAEPEWSQWIDQVLFKGVRSIAEEVVFFHKPTQTLILTDLMFNVAPAKTLSEKIFFSLNKMGKGPKPTRLSRFMINDKREARTSIDRLLSWQPERVILAHGAPVLTNGAQVLKDAFAWL